MLEIKNLTIKIGGKEIIKELSLVLHEQDKMAIIGEEGNGKSTLLRAIASQPMDYAQITGIIQCHGHLVGYLAQQLDPNYFNITGKNYLFSDETEYYQCVNVFYRLLNELDLKEDVILNQPMGSLSGGEKVKLQLLKILLQEPDILLLDEPTNNLDLDTLEWLEKFIITCRMPILYVSHDEYLLNKTANRILHLELVEKKQKARHKIFQGSYDTYIKERLQWLDKQTMIAQKERQQYHKKESKLKQITQRVEHQQQTITRADPHGAKMLKRKMKSLKSQEKRLASTSLTKIPAVEEAICLFFPKTYLPQQKEIVNITIPELKIKDNVLARDISLVVRGGAHIGIIGQNGVGKTTLLKYLLEQLKDRTDIKVGYMPQQYEDILDFYATPISFLAITGHQNESSLFRSYLGNLKFTKEEMTDTIGYLSGGSQAKLLLLKLVVDQKNVLLLDEPTRNISPLSNPIIRQILKEFDGTIISVSHDRMYLNDVCHCIYELTKTGLVEK